MTDAFRARARIRNSSVLYMQHLNVAQKILGKTLTERIALDLEHLHSHTSLLVRAIEWGNGQSDSLLLRGDDLANAILEDAVKESEKKMALRIKIGSGILAGTLLLSVGAGVKAALAVKNATDDINAYVRILIWSLREVLRRKTSLKDQK